MSDLLQNLDLALQDISLVREVFHELLVSAAKHSHEHSRLLLWILTKRAIKVTWISAGENIVFSDMKDTLHIHHEDKNHNK